MSIDIYYVFNTSIIYWKIWLVFVVWKEKKSWVFI